MSINSLLIKRLSYLEKIDAETQRYRKIFNWPIPNVSGWAISNEYKDSMLAEFDCQEYGTFNPIDYVYSYDIEQYNRFTLISKLGGNNNNKLLLTQNNTISLINVINFISKVCDKNIGLLLPCYFTIPNLLINRQKGFTGISMIHAETGYRLPVKEIENKKINTLILTSPIFSTGIYLSDNDINYLKKYLNDGNYLIADESLAAPGKELIRFLGYSPRFVGIYSPHKFIHFNAFKFSCILYNRQYEDFFDQWADVYSGSLNITNLQAIRHFFSQNYKIMLEHFYKFTNEKRKAIENMLNYYPQFRTDENAIGDYQTIYNNKLPYKIGDSISFIKDIIKNTQAIFYPGCLHGFQKEHGFVFRINLTSYTTQVQNSLLKILDYLSEL